VKDRFSTQLSPMLTGIANGRCAPTFQPSHRNGEVRPFPDIRLGVEVDTADMPNVPSSRFGISEITCFAASPRLQYSDSGKITHCGVAECGATAESGGARTPARSLCHQFQFGECCGQLVLVKYAKTSKSAVLNQYFIPYAALSINHPVLRKIQPFFRKLINDVFGVVGNTYATVIGSNNSDHLAVNFIGVMGSVTGFRWMLFPKT
jgi:hypothetical protein